MEIETLLAEIGPADRAGLGRLQIARIRRDRDAIRREESAVIERWRRLYDLNRRFADRIGEVATRGGHDRQRRWERRWLAAAFPWLCKPTELDRQWAWIVEAKLPAERLAAAASAYEAYADRRHGLAVRAVELMIQARTELSRIIHPMSSAADLQNAAALRIYEELLRNSGSRSAAAASAAADLRAVLTDDERRTMNDAIR
jgi:hypothetical protein